MKNIIGKILTVLTVGMVVACGILHKPTPQPSTNVQVVVKDSTVIRDSLRVVDLPVERIVDMVAVYDTLELETSLAKSRAWVDTNRHMLVGDIENKNQAKIKVEYRDRIIYRDSIYTKEVPVPYEVVKEVTKYPTLFWILLAFAITVIGIKAPKLVKSINTILKFDWKKLLFWKKNKKNPEV